MFYVTDLDPVLDSDWLIGIPRALNGQLYYTFHCIDFHSYACRASQLSRSQTQNLSSALEPDSLENPTMHHKKITSYFTSNFQY